MRKSVYKAQHNRQRNENKAVKASAGFMKIMNLLARLKA